MMGRFAAAWLAAGGLAGAAMGAVSACGGDAFTLAPRDGGAGPGADVWSGGGGEGGEAAPEGTDAPEEPPVEAGADGISTDAIALPDAIDEAPAHCTGSFDCIPPIPAGWQGPFEMYRGDSAPTSCSPNFFPSYQGNDSVDAGPASCGCSCGLATGVECSSVSATFYVSTLGVTSCASVGHCTDVSLPPSTCVPGIDVAMTQCPGVLGSTGLSTNFAAGNPTADGGSCPPVPTTTLPEVHWDIATRACISMVATAQVDCPAGTVCAPSPAQPYDSTLCIARAGDVPCPLVGYTTRSVSFDDVLDTRRCTGCACGAVTGSTCTGYVDVTPTPSSPSGASCGSNYTRYVLPVSCDPVQQPGDFRATVTPQPGSCAPTEPTADGTVLPASPVTFCCH